MLHQSSAKRSRRAFIFAAVVAGLVPSVAPAQEGLITILVAFPAGGGVDRAARILAEKLGEELKRAVVVDNRPGAAGQIAARMLKQAPADGSVLLMTNSHPIVTVPHTVLKPGYNAFTDFRPVSNFVNFETVIVSTNETKTLQALGSWTKQKNDYLNIGVPSPGGLPDFMVTAIGKTLNVPAQSVPYKGAQPLTADLLGKQIPAGIVTMTEALLYGPSGKLNILAASRKSSQLPGVPSFAEVGLKDLDATDFIAVFAPAALSDAVTARYSAAIRRVGAMPEVAEKLRAQGQEVNTATGAEFVDRMQRMSRSAHELMQASGFKPE